MFFSVVNGVATISRMLTTVVTVCALLANDPNPGQITGPQQPPNFEVGGTGLLFIERSEPGLDGGTPAVSVGFRALLHGRVDLVVEGGVAKFFGRDREGHRDLFLSGLAALRLTRRRARAPFVGPTLVVGATWLHSQLHSHFGELSTNQTAFTVGFDYAIALADRWTLAAGWRLDLSAGIVSNRPGIAVRYGF